MKLKKFIKKYIEHNTSIRLWFQHPTEKSAYTYSYFNGKTSMEWEILKKEGIYKDFGNHKVIDITDILVPGNMVEAVNIIIK